MDARERERERERKLGLGLGRKYSCSRLATVHVSRCYKRKKNQDTNETGLKRLTRDYSINTLERRVRIIVTSIRSIDATILVRSLSTIDALTAFHRVILLFLLQSTVLVVPRYSRPV